jgi:hypothetical protein
MKNIFKILLAAVTCLALIPLAKSQTNQYGAYTNVIKVSALPAVSSIAGTELVPLTQGGVSRYATVNQLLAGAVGAANTFDNYFLLLQGTNQAAWNATASNGLAYTTNQFIFAMAYAYALSNQMQIAWLNEVTTRQAVDSAGSNNLNAASNVVMAAIIASNAALSSAISASQSAIAIATNGIFSTTIITNLVQPSVINSFTVSATSTNTFSLAAGGLQQSLLNPTVNGVVWWITPTNMADGQSVSQLVRNINSANSVYADPHPNEKNPNFRYLFNYAVNSYFQLGLAPGQSCIYTWQCIGTNVFVSYSSVF